MNKQELIDKLPGLMAENFGNRAEDYISSADLVEDLGLDSLDIVEAIMVIEEESGLAIPDPEENTIGTYADLVSLIPDF